MIKIYGKPNCPYCVKAKDLAEVNKVSYEYIDLAQNNDILEEMKQKGHKSVPIIYKDSGEFIGGYVELYKSIKEFM